MNPLKKAYCRIFQNIFKFALPLLPYSNPKIIGSVKGIPEVLEKRDYNNVLIITDAGIRSLGLTERLEQTLKRSCISYHIYDKTVANPTTVNVDEALHMYLDNDCQAIIGFGGGSSMDCAKATAARIAKPHQSLAQMKGILKIHKKLPLLIAIPTTAGTGSETTLAAVITDAQTRHKYAINDFPLIPRYAVLDPKVTLSLPPFITATTGMDALTHAIESYITPGAWAMSDMFELKAIEMIAANLKAAVDNGNDVAAREAMSQAQYIAGMGFSNVGLGIVHSMAHPLGAHYDTPHGVANALLLPYVMEYNAESPAAPKYIHIAKAMGVNTDGMTESEGIRAAVDAVRKLSLSIGIPQKLHEINVKEEDLHQLAVDAFNDVCTGGNPRPTSVEEIEALYRKAF